MQAWQTAIFDLASKNTKSHTQATNPDMCDSGGFLKHILYVPQTSTNLSSQ